jgi:quinol monooxygenase YgiN
MIRHVAMFRFKPGVTDEQREAAREALMTNATHCPTVRGYTVGLDLGRKPANWDMVLVADFDDLEGMEAYSTHPHHNKIAKQNDALTQADVTARVQFEF